MSDTENHSGLNPVIAGIPVTTASGTVKPASKAANALACLSGLETERQQRKLAEKISRKLIEKFEIPLYSGFYAGKLCGSEAKTNENEIYHWVLRETAEIEDMADLDESELVRQLARKLWDILEEIKNGHC